jgi:non-specific serine/threonine protein kinase
MDKYFIDKYDIVITTYSLSKKYDWLKLYKWNYVILDEAQIIKNPGTKQTKAVKNLDANNRIIMTGTPIENRLGDIWSLFDFLNPGLLGSIKEFSDFSKGLKDNLNGYAKLKKITSPYILRRLKTDKSVISDLPDKIEMKTYSDLTKKQVILYGNLVEELKTKLEDESEGIKRKGLILASLMKFKQLCNHPDQYLGRDEYSELDSGKFFRLREICETIYEKRERVLVFTQFKEITEPLKEFLETVFKHKGLVFHGSTSVKKRKEIVEKFQKHEYVPFMVLSIKAGGVGLNLTSANHVIHFDRWWNPAVENQATDRAFRIGQKKNVIVHKFITRGTLEEKIDAMLQEKANLSNEIIQSTNEAWITEMNNDKLINLFTLSLQK